MSRIFTQLIIPSLLVTLGGSTSAVMANDAAAKTDPNKVCGIMNVTIIEKNAAGAWEEKVGKAESCKGTAKWGSFGETAKDRQYQIITYFKIPEFQTRLKTGHERMKKSLSSSIQDTMFLYSEAFPKSKWQGKWKKGDKVQTISNLLIAGKVHQVPSTVEIVEKDGKRFSHMTTKISRKTLGMPDIDTDSFKINDTMTISSVIPFSAVKGSL